MTFADAWTRIGIVHAWQSWPQQALAVVSGEYKALLADRDKASSQARLWKRLSAYKRGVIKELDAMIMESTDAEMRAKAERRRYREAACRLRRFMDAYFTEDNITDEAGNVLGETAWLDAAGEGGGRG